MALPSSDLQKLKQMQALCDKVIDHTETLNLSLKTIRLFNSDLRQLGSLYDEDWLRIHGDTRLSESDLKELQAIGKHGRYSVLSEDTIWNALHSARQVQISLIKLLVKHL